MVLHLAPHRLQANPALFRHPVGRSEGLRRQIAHLQQRRGFQPPEKFTYSALSEVG